jgi:hypothetical protein
MVITERLRMEDDEKFSAALGSSPHRKDLLDGSVTFVGKQEHDDEVLRTHYLLNKIRSQKDVPPIARGALPPPVVEH